MITLQANKWLGALTNLIALATYADTLQSGSVSRLIDSSEAERVPTGDGKVIRHVDMPEVKDLEETSSLLTITKPTVGEQYIPVSAYKVVPLSINAYLLPQAFVDETQMASFVAYILSSMRAAKNAYIYGALLDEYQKWTPAQESQKITVNLKPTETLTGADLQMTKTYNSNTIAKALLNTLIEMEAPTSEYNDAKLTEIIDRGSLKLVISARYDIDLIVDTFSTLFDARRMEEDERWSETITIPAGQLKKHSIPDTVIGWLVDKKKIQFGYFYEVATSFFDASNLNTNHWLHFAYYMDEVKALPGVLITASYGE